MERGVSETLEALANLSEHVLSDSVALARRRRELDRQSRRLEDASQMVRVLIAALDDRGCYPGAAGGAPPP
jgi:hypothetical protein